MLHSHKKDTHKHTNANTWWNESAPAFHINYYTTNVSYHVFHHLKAVVTYNSDDLHYLIFLEINSIFIKKDLKTIKNLKINEEY